jgi:hypothetical protein
MAVLVLWRAHAMQPCDTWTRTLWQGADVPGVVLPDGGAPVEKGGGVESEHEWKLGVSNNSPNENTLTNV